jgi:hypothetical protein
MTSYSYGGQTSRSKKCFTNSLSFSFLGYTIRKEILKDNPKT